MNTVPVLPFTNQTAVLAADGSTDAKLREAHMKIEQIRVKSDGSADTEPFDA